MLYVEAGTDPTRNGTWMPTLNNICGITRGKLHAVSFIRGTLNLRLENSQEASIII